MDQDKVNILYNAAKHYYDENDVGSIGDFTNYLSDENQRRALYEDLTQNHGVKFGSPDYDTWSRGLGFAQNMHGQQAPKENILNVTPQQQYQQQAVNAQPQQYRAPQPQPQQPAQTQFAGQLPSEERPADLNDHGMTGNINRLQQMREQWNGAAPTVDFDAHQVGSLTPGQKQQAVNTQLMNEAQQRVNFQHFFDDNVKPLLAENAEERMQRIQAGGDPNLAYAEANNPIYHARQAMEALDETKLAEYIQKQYGSELASMSKEQQAQVRDEVAQQIEAAVIDDYVSKNQIQGDADYIMRSIGQGVLLTKISRALGNVLEKGLTGGDVSRRLNEIDDQILSSYSQKLAEEGMLKSSVINGGIGAATIMLDAPFFAMFDMPVAWFQGLHGAKYLFDAATKTPNILGSAISQGMNWGLYGLTGNVADRAATTRVNDQGVIVSTAYEYDENGKQVEVERPLTFSNVFKDTVGAFSSEFAKGAVMGTFSHMRAPFMRKGSIFGKAGKAAANVGLFGIEGGILTGMSAGEQMLEGAQLDMKDLAGMAGQNYAMIGISRLNPTHMIDAVYRWKQSTVRPEYLNLLNAKGYSTAHVMQTLSRMAEPDMQNVDQATLDGFKADYEKMMSDTSIPLSLRYQMRAVVEGKQPAPMVMPRTASVRAVEMVGGKWVVEKLDLSGQVADFAIVRDEKAAQQFMQNPDIQAEIENTHLDALEASLGSRDLVGQASDAALSFQSIQSALVDPNVKAYTPQDIAEARWATQMGIATPEQQQIVEQANKAAQQSYNVLRDYQAREAAKRAAQNILGSNLQHVKVKEALETERRRRTPEQQALVDEYRKQLEEILSENAGQMEVHMKAVDTAVQNAMAEVNDLSNTTTGELIVASALSEVDPVHITGGNIVADQYGFVDTEASSKHVVIRTAKGERKMIDIHEIMNVMDRKTAEEYRKQVEDAAKAEEARKIAEETEQKVAAAAEQNKMDQELEKTVETAEAKTEDVEAETPEADEREGKRYKFYDAEDNEIEGDFMGEVSGGKIAIKDASGRVHEVYPDELEEVGNKAPAKTETKTETAAPAKPEEKPMFEMPVTATESSERRGGMAFEGDEPILTSVEPQQALDYLNDVLKLDKNEQIDYVIKQLEQASKKSSEISGMYPDIKKLSIGEYTKAKAQWEAAVDAWEKEYNHYNEMYKALKGKDYFEYEIPKNEDQEPQKTVHAEPVPEPNDAAGLQIGTHADKIGAQDQQLLDAMGKQYGLEVVAVSPEEMPEIEGKRGMFLDKQNKIYINVDNHSRKTANWIMGHEITHKIKTTNPKHYDSLVAAMREHLGKEYEARLNHMLDLYGQMMDKDGITDPEARKAYVEEEMCADLAGDLLDSSSDFAQHIITEAQRDSAMSGKYLSVVRDAINFIRDVMRSFSHLFEDADAVDKLYDARLAFEKCYREAVKINGAKGSIERDSIDVKPEDMIGGSEETKADRLTDEIKPEAVEKSNREAEISGGIIHDNTGKSIGVIDNSGNLTPRFCLETAEDFRDNLGEWHKGTHQTVLDYMREKGYSKKQIKAMDEKMSWWQDYMRNISDFQNEDGSFRFEAFREWNQRTPEYKSVGKDMEKALTSLVNNGEYPINLELTTDCIKREAFTQLLNEMVRIDDGRAIRNMNPAEITAIQDMMKTYGIQTACPLCFVEGKRLGIRNWAERIVHDWNCQLNDALDLGVEKVKVPLNKDDFYYAIDADAVAEAIEAKFGTADSRFNFGQGDYVSETSLDAMADMSERQRQAKLINDTFDLLSGRRGGLLSDDLQTIEANAKAVEAKLLELENAWYQKNPDKPYQMTKKDAAVIAKLQNDGIKTVAGKMAQTISQYPELRKVLTINDLIGSTGLDAIRTRNGEGYARLFSHIVSRFGAGTPKVVQRAEPYVGEILSLNNDKIEAANKIGGSRLFSFSDFDVTKVFDIMQIFFDAEARGLKLQSYSKEVPYILMFGRGTNAKINMSTLVEAKPLEADIQAYRNAKTEKQRKEIKHRIEEYAGLNRDENGNIVGFQWSGTHSVSPEFAEAIYRNPDYNGNCGATTVGVSINHTIYSCLTPWIRQVIPFHLSGMPIAARERTDVGWYRDSTSEQNTRKIGADGKATAISHKDDFDFYAGEDQKGWDMRDRCRQYVAWCNNRGYLPRFEWCLNSDNYIKWCEDNGYTPDKQILEGMRANERTVTVTDENGKKQKIKMFDGYYKVITDFNCYKPEFDADGNFIGEKNAPHTNIKADFVRDEQMLGAIFTDEDSMLQNREDNIRNANDQVTNLADKAIRMLKGEITLEEAKNPSAESFRNAEDSEKYLQGVREGRFSIDEPGDKVMDSIKDFIDTASDIDDSQRKKLSDEISNTAMQINADRKYTDELVRDGYAVELGNSARTCQVLIDSLQQQIDNASQMNNTFDYAKARLEQHRLEDRRDYILKQIDDAGLKRTELNIADGRMSSKDVDTLFYKLNHDEENLELYERVKEVADYLGVTYSFFPLDDGKKASMMGVTGLGHITYSTSAFNSPMVPDQRKARTMLHEMIHGVSEYVFEAYRHNPETFANAWSPKERKVLRNAIEDIKGVWEQMQTDPEFAREYGKSAYFESLAEMANPRFREKLQKMNLWEQFVDGVKRFIRAILGKTEEGTATTGYEKMDKALETILTTPDLRFFRWIDSKYGSFTDESNIDTLYDSVIHNREARDINRGRTKGIGIDDTRFSIDEAEKEVNTDPTEAQKKAGNYRMGHVKVGGYNVTIENPKGSVRRGTDANGKAWETPMNNTYGYIRGTEGVDGDHIDIFLSDNPEEGKVYVVDQINPGTGNFDEHKVMFGFNSADEARKAYLSNYSKDWKGLGNITEVSKDEFKKWVDSSHRKTKPFAEYAMARKKSAEVNGNLIGEPGSMKDLKSGLDDNQWKRNLMSLTQALPEDVRTEIVSQMRNGGSYDIASAAMRYLGDLAERREESPAWESIARSINQMYGTNLNANEARYMMWRTYRNQEPHDYSRTGLLAEDYAQRLHNGMLKTTTTPPTGGDGGKRYSLEEVSDYDKEMGTDVKSVVELYNRLNNHEDIQEFTSKFYKVAKTSDFLKRIGITGDFFSIRGGVASRHFGKDKNHSIKPEEFVEIVQAVNDPIAVTLYSPNSKSYRIWTKAKIGDHLAIVGVDVKNGGRNVEINSIATIFGANKAKLAEENLVYPKSINEINPDYRSVIEHEFFAVPC